MDPQQHISYYDAIASFYDRIMEKDPANSLVRQWVAETFQNTVKEGLVLDFGGGTGSDLPWLLKKYTVIFCEPSANMRNQAMKNYPPGGSVKYLENGETDFHKWDGHFPFSGQLDGVLCNFAVLNCIADIAILFRRLAAVTKPGAHVIALILDNRLAGMLRRSFKRTLRSLVTGAPFTFTVSYNGNSHTVFLHSHRAIRKACGTYFYVRSKQLKEKTDYCLIHLERK